MRILDVIWLLLLLGMLGYFWRDRKQLAQTKNWLITSGRITRFEWTKESHHFWPKIEYTYQVFDREFHGHYLFLDTFHNNPNSKYARKVAYRAAIAFERNAAIDVFYNPNNPQEAALDIGIPKKLNIIIGLLLVLTGFHLGVMLVRWLS